MDSVKQPQSLPRPPRLVRVAIQPLSRPTTFTNRTSRSSYRLLIGVELIFTFLIALAAAAIAPYLRTHHVLTITSGSMAPTIPTGSLVAIASQPSRPYTIGDIIAFRTPHGITTHRIIKDQDPGPGKFRTRGDANATADPHPVEASQIIGPVSVSLPYLGYGVAALKTRLGFSLIVLLPSTVIVMHELRALRRSWHALRQYPSFIAPATLAIVGLLTTGSLVYAALSATATASGISLSTAATFPTPTPEPTSEPTPEPTPEPSPTPCAPDTEIRQENTQTGTDSVNENITTIETHCTTEEENSATVENAFTIDSNSGGDINIGITVTNSIQ